MFAFALFAASVAEEFVVNGSNIPITCEECRVMENMAWRVTHINGIVTTQCVAAESCEGKVSNEGVVECVVDDSSCDELPAGVEWRKMGTFTETRCKPDLDPRDCLADPACTFAESQLDDPFAPTDYHCVLIGLNGATYWNCPHTRSMRLQPDNAPPAEVFESRVYEPKKDVVSAEEPTGFPWDLSRCDDCVMTPGMAWHVLFTATGSYAKYDTRVSAQCVQASECEEISSLNRTSICMKHVCQLPSMEYEGIHLDQYTANTTYWRCAVVPSLEHCPTDDCALVRNDAGENPPFYCSWRFFTQYFDRADRKSVV